MRGFVFACVRGSVCVRGFLGARVRAWVRSYMHVCVCMRARLRMCVDECVGVGVRVGVDGYACPYPRACACMFVFVWASARVWRVCSYACVHVRVRVTVRVEDTSCAWECDSEYSCVCGYE